MNNDSLRLHRETVINRQTDRHICDKHKSTWGGHDLIHNSLIHYT